MFSSTVLDVAVGLIFVFFVVSLAASAILEAIAGIVTWRSGTLLKGVKDLLNDKQFTGLAAQLYQHALINPRNDGCGGQTVVGQGPIVEAALRKDAPAYIDPKQFADALIDILNTGKPTVAADAAGHPGKMASGNSGSIARAIDHVVPPADNPQINALLKGMSRRAESDLDKMRAEVADWFDSAMDRVSGVYKRWTQLWHFLIALALAVLLNISALHVASDLWKQPTAAKSIENSKSLSDSKDAVAAIRQLDTLALPIGWFNYRLPAEGGEATSPKWWEDYPEMVLGWLITALAALFGAPFWFDLLQKVIRLKGSGPSPGEKKDKTAAAQ
jgi:hypothetical protein